MKQLYTKPYVNLTFLDNDIILASSVFDEKSNEHIVTDDDWGVNQ